MVNSFRSLPLPLLVLAFLLGFAPLSEARHFHSESRGDMEMFFFYKAGLFLRCGEQLGLTEEQIDKIKTLRLEARKEMIRQDSQIEILALDIHAALHKRPVDVNAVNKLLDQKFEVKKAKAKYLVRALADLKGIPTDAQYEKLKSLWSGKKR